jgi:hypothetical protein
VQWVHDLEVRDGPIGPHRKFELKASLDALFECRLGIVDVEVQGAHPAHDARGAFGQPECGYFLDIGIRGEVPGRIVL